MDWLFGLAAEHGHLVGEVASETGNELLDIQELRTRGLPSDTSCRKGCITLNFAQWSRTNDEAYLGAFGIEKPDVASTRHQLFTAVHKGTTLVVPALVLIRAIFKPSKHFLPLVFRPQFLDRISHIQVNQSKNDIVLDTRWADLSDTRGLAPVNPALTWMRAHPSATDMASSVCRYALAGAVGLDLPSGHAQFAVRGRLIDATIFATDMTIQVVEAGDEPIDAFDGATGRYLFNGSPGENDPERVCRVADFSDVPIRADGTVGLTDGEWNAVAGYLRCCQPPRLDQRAILDGLLYKLSTGTGWHSVPYRAGNHLNAQIAFRRWVERGALQQVFDVLRDFRSSHARPM